MKLPAVLSDGFLQALPEAERKRLGRASMTKAEAQAKYRAGKEKELQKQVATWLFRNGHYFNSDRMDKRTSGEKGRADFRCCIKDGSGIGRWLSIECKTEAGTLSPEQARDAARLRASGGKFVLAFSLEDVIEAVNDMRAI